MHESTMRTILLFGLLTFLGPFNAATATPIRTYELSLTFSCIDDWSTSESECLNEFADVRTGRSVQTNVAYKGQFTVVESAFETDGYKDVGFASFYFALGDTVWDSGRPCNLAVAASDYCGTRGYNPETRCCGLGAPWTFLVKDHELDGLCCGVFGRQDFPFMDLYSQEWNGTFVGGLVDNFAGVSAFYYRGLPECPDCVNPFYALGTFTFIRVPEPAASSLFALGLLVVAFRWRSMTSNALKRALG